MVALFLLVAVGGTTTALMLALEQNINMFYPPAQVVAGEAPAGETIRAGGMVMEGSVQRAPDSLQVSFVLSDFQGSDFTVVYTGILPDLFREGQGILVQGELQRDGTFMAQEVLAKHDENYMPPELLDMASSDGEKN
jgi:cytochrome c-type biogenesis protein CcmE